ncbi:Rhs-family protein [Cronobacter condimenti 1330]|uniref:Rhs-family protein n=1 Tax=Cronobacter condimenti 1330 TaxID=1073999 RepID=K8AHP9_9ENTR|nr:Rhs-family protein [Cronobacter condimenti 1330]
MVSAADPAGHLTRLQYDRLGRLTTLVNPNRESWRFVVLQNFIAR